MKWVVAEHEGVAGITLEVPVDGTDVDEEDVVLPEDDSRFGALHEVLGGVGSAAHDDVVPAASHSELAQRRPGDLLAWSSDMPGVICSAIMWTAFRVRARTAMKPSNLKAVPVPSMVLTSVIVIGPSRGASGFGEGCEVGLAATRSTSAVDFSAPKR